MPVAMTPLENPLTHRHGMIGCYLQDGVDPTAPPIAMLPPAPAGTAPGVVMPALPPLISLTAMPPMPSVLGYVAVAAAYFALGVAVGALVRRLRRLRTLALSVLVVPGVLAGLGFLAWVVYSLV
jgi:hypothetical protein